MRLHFATVWEAMADALGDDVAVAQGEATRTWTDFEDRAARLAAAFDASGLRPDSKVGLYLYNGPEYLEANFAALKMRGVPVNINYRYVDEELWYVLDDADVEALVLHESLAARVERVRDRLPKLKLVVVVDEGSAGATVRDADGYEDLIASHQPMPRIERSEDDIYMLYTGGTTGRPKGVMQRIGDFTQMFIERGCAVRPPLAPRSGRPPRCGARSTSRGSPARQPGNPAVDARHRALAGFDDAPLRRRQGRAPHQSVLRRRRGDPSCSQRTRRLRRPRG